MKRLITLSLLCITLTSCGSYMKDNSDTTPNNETATNNETTNEPTTPSTDSSDNASTDTPTVDAVSTPSITGDPAEFEKSLSDEGNWLTAALNDISLDKDLNVDGEYRSKNDPTQEIYRKLALYTQDSDKNVTGTFTLTVPNMIVTSENFRVQEGVVKGNVTVKANGFELKNATIDGDLTFESDEFKQSAKLEEGTVTGKIN